MRKERGKREKGEENGNDISLVDHIIEQYQSVYMESKGNT